MLEKIDLSKKISKADYQALFPALELKLGELQRRTRELKIPVIIVFEGWDAAGKGTLINKVSLALDSRGFNVIPINQPNEEERLRPFLWRFWIRTPENGKFAIFDRSWYGRVLIERIDKVVKKKIWSQAFEEIKSFEHQLVDGGNVIIKFFLHIDAKEQRRRFKKLEKNPTTDWKVTTDDWRHHRQYRKYVKAIEEALAKTDSDFAPWTIVEAHDRYFAVVKVFQTLIATLESKIRAFESPKLAVAPPAAGIILPEHISTTLLEKVDLTLSLSPAEYESSLGKYQKRLRELEHELYRQRVPLIIVYQGWDAAGKGGNIKRLVQGLDPRGYEVIPIGAPNDLEKAHHYLWRFWLKMPKAGHIAIFDRSWYGRVLDERVEGFCTEMEWRRAFREINELELQLVEEGALLLKFWLQIDPAEQLKRFEERQQSPYKQWKITAEDWRNREKWDRYVIAVNEMLARTSTSYANWHIVESNNKWYARIKVLKIVTEAIEARI